MGGLGRPKLVSLTMIYSGDDVISSSQDPTKVATVGNANFEIEVEIKKRKSKVKPKSKLEVEIDIGLSKSL